MNLDQEMKQAEQRYGHFNSTHEVYGVLKEEVDEFWDEVKVSKKFFLDDAQKEWEQHKIRRMIEELTQIAAVALRAANELEENKIKFV